MNVEIGTEEYLLRIFGIVSLQCMESVMSLAAGVLFSFAGAEGGAKTKQFHRQGPILYSRLMLSLCVHCSRLKPTKPYVES